MMTSVIRLQTALLSTQKNERCEEEESSLLIATMNLYYLITTDIMVSLIYVNTPPLFETFVLIRILMLWFAIILRFLNKL